MDEPSLILIVVPIVIPLALASGIALPLIADSSPNDGSHTQVRKFADIRPVADGHGQPERQGARFGGVRMGPAPWPETGKPAPGLAGAPAWTRASTCTDRGPPGPPPGSRPPQPGAGVRVRSSQRWVSRSYQLRPFVAQN